MSRSARTMRCSDSPRENPRSRNTFPVDGVTLTAFFFAMLVIRVRERTEPVAADLEIACARLLRLLLKRVEAVDCLGSSCYVNHAMCAGDVNPNFTHSNSDCLHRFPVVWLQSLLHASQLEASKPACERREGTKISPRAAEPDERFVRHRS